MVLFKPYKQLHLTFSTSCVTCLKIISWITWTMQVQCNQDMSDKRMPGETQEMWQAVWGGKVRGWNTMRGAAWWQAWKSLDKYFCQGKHFTVHYTVTRKVCAGLKPIWLVQVWRQRDLESIVLDLRVRTYPPISAFTQDWNPPTLFFNITSSGPYPWSILTDQSSFIVLLLCGQRWYSESKRFDRANLLWHFHQKKTQDNKTSNSSNHTCHCDVYTTNIISCKDWKKIHLDKCCRQVKGVRSPPRYSSMAATTLGSATRIVRCLHGGAGPQQQHDHLDVALLCRQVQRRLASAGRGGHEARPTGQGVSERELENSQAAHP